MGRTYKTRLHRIVGTGKRRAQSGVRAIPETEEWDRALQELQTMALGAAVLAYAEANSEFRESLRKVLVARITDPEDMAMFPEFFPPPYRSIQ
jgi:hypothetical protein